MKEKGVESIEIEGRNTKGLLLVKGKAGANAVVGPGMG